MIQEGSFVWVESPQEGRPVVGKVLRIDGGGHHVRWPTKEGHADRVCAEEELEEVDLSGFTPRASS